MRDKKTPLYLACKSGELDIARYLIQHGADFEIASLKGSTCLMAACAKERYEIVEYLLKCGADVNRKTESGTTALHFCANSGCLRILYLLLKYGAKLDVDSNGISPLLSAASNGHVDFVEYCFKECYCIKLEKIHALELLGADVIEKNNDDLRFLNFWRKAMEMRYEDIAVPLEKPQIQSSVAAYLDTTEVRTFHQLEELMSNPDERWMQALLVRERILGPNFDAAALYFKRNADECDELGNFKGCIGLLMYALDILQRTSDQPCQYNLKEYTIYILLDLVNALAIISNPLDAAFRVANTFQVLLRAKEIETGIHYCKRNCVCVKSYMFDEFLEITIRLLGILCQLLPNMSKQEEIELKKVSYRLVHLNPRMKSGQTPLHLSCSKRSYNLPNFPSLELVDLFLEVGACPNAVDKDNNTPLHIISNTLKYKVNECSRAIIRSLLNHGAHLDFRNNEGETPLQLVHSFVGLDMAVLDICPLRYLNLQCLCAQVIRTNQILYKGLVQEKLEKFLDSH